MIPQGFTFGAAAAGLKPNGDLDVGIIVSDRPAVAAAVVTTNRFQAAPIIVSKRNLRDGSARAIVANAGNANACTGRQGLTDAAAMASETAKLFGIDDKAVLVASTGVIGRTMAMDKIRPGIGAAASVMSTDPAPFANAIMTTDTVPKTASSRAGEATVFGVAKGAGMIAPEMATMLCFIGTDAAVSRTLLSQALIRAAAKSFNLISVDGCMSTNDCIFVLANGASGVQFEDDSPAFEEALTTVCSSLARQIVEDGEGISKVVAVSVRGAKNKREAVQAARRIADSALLRCAIGGADPNWGRVLAALGTVSFSFDPHTVDVWLGGQKLAERGTVGPGDLDLAKKAMGEREVEIVVDLGRGSSEATMLTNDLTAEYVRINGDYTT